jgi:hypothetical protein
VAGYHVELPGLLRTPKFRIWSSWPVRDMMFVWKESVPPLSTIEWSKSIVYWFPHNNLENAVAGAPPFMTDGINRENLKFSGQMGVRMPIRTSIESVWEKPVQPERYQLLIGSTGEVQIWWMGEATDGPTNEPRFGPSCGQEGLKV